MVVSVGGIKAETKHIWNDLNPTFPESLQLKLPANTIYPVTVRLGLILRQAACCSPLLHLSQRDFQNREVAILP